MKLRKNRRGFTIVELVIVVAVIGVLAAVLIPTFVNLTNKANKAADNSLVANLNTALAGREGEADDTANHTMQDAIDDLEIWGYKLTNLVTKSKEKLLWNEKTNRFLLEDDELVKNSSTPEQFWQIADSIPSTQKFSLLAGNKWNGTAAEGLTVGFDIGAHKEIQTVSYVGTNKNVSFRTVGGKLNIGADGNIANGEIRSYGSADKVTVYTATECFYSHSVISYMDLKEGKAIASTNGVIYLMKAEEGTIVAEEDNGVVVIPTSATIEDIQTNVANLPTGYSFDDDGHIVQPADIAQKVAENQGLLGSGTESDPFQIYDKATMQAVTLMYETGFHYYKVNIERTDNGKIDCSGWTGINLYGSFDGNGVVFKNLDKPLFNKANSDNSKGVTLKNFNVDNCFIMTGSYYVGAVLRVAYHDVTMEDINISGYLEANSPASFIGQGNFYDENCTINFIRCHSNMNLVSLNAQAGGFTGNLFGNYYNKNHLCTVNLIDSYFDGSLAVASGSRFSYIECHTASPIAYTISYTNEAIQNYCSSLYSTGQTEAKDVNYLGNTKTLTKGSLSLPAIGSTFTVNKTEGAVSAKAYVIVGLNPGNITGVYVSDEIDLSNISGDTFTTNNVKNYEVVVNDGIHNKTEISENTLYIFNSNFESGYHGVTFMVVQYDSLGGIVSVSTTSK